MITRSLLFVMVSLALLIPVPVNAGDRAGGIEPGAGEWKTWVISSGRDYRVPPPPGRAQTRAELRALADLISGNDEDAQAQIAFWDAGAPAYRWLDLINARALAGAPIAAPLSSGRVYTYVALAMYDATVATWESKQFYGRRRPSEVDHRLETALPVPDSPSYPSEHAAAAQAAATVLAHFLPAEAAAFQAMAEEAAGRACWRACSIQVTTRLDWRSDGPWVSRSSRKRWPMAQLRHGREACRPARASGSGPTRETSRQPTGRRSCSRRRVNSGRPSRRRATRRR